MSRFRPHLLRLLANPILVVRRLASIALIATLDTVALMCDYLTEFVTYIVDGSVRTCVSPLDLLPPGSANLTHGVLLTTRQLVVKLR